MEYILYILGFIIAVNFAGAILGAILGGLKSLFVSGVAKAAPNTEFAKRVNPESFNIVAKIEDVSFGDQELESITVSFKGAIELPNDDMECSFILLMRDVTDEDEPGFIFSSIDELQENETVFFQFISRPETIPYQHSIVSQPISIVSIPTDFLRFPKKGARKVKLLLLLANASRVPEIKYGSIVSNKQFIYAVAETILYYRNENLGYIDLKEYSKRIEELSIFLAMHVSGIDGEFHVAEGNLIREWIKKKIDSRQLSSEEITEEKQRYNAYIKKAFKVAEEGRLDLDKCCAELEEKGSAADLYDVLELCMHSASADGKAEGVELETIKDISRKLKLDPNRFREMHDKILPISVHVEDQEREVLLGITSKMSTEEIRKHLNSEYRKWNSRVTHSDPKIREQADEMLKVIAECRTKYVG